MPRESMPKIAVCTAIYEAARPFLGRWMASVLAAAEHTSLGLIVAADNVPDAETMLQPVATRLPVRIVAVNGPSTSATVRHAMLDAARASDAEILVLSDSDDEILPETPRRHLAALAEADFSYGDLLLVDRDNGTLGRELFHDADVPRWIDRIDPLLRRNFCGFGNTAVRRARLAPEICAIPRDLVAADWWFFSTLVLNGRRGACTDAPVGLYRMHSDSALVHGSRKGVEIALRQAAVVRRHYAALPRTTQVAAADADVAALMRRLTDAPATLAAEVERDRARPGVWHEHISRLAALVARDEARASA